MQHSTTSADSIATVQFVDEELHSYCEGEQVYVLYSKLLLTRQQH